MKKIKNKEKIGFHVIIFPRNSLINGYSNTQRTPNLHLRDQGKCPQKTTSELMLK